MIRASLRACMAYVSHRELLIRPADRAIRFHDAFGAAGHRLYWSAALGQGGELERGFGQRKITRIPVPANWETQGAGRRFFVFPDLLSGLGNEERDVLTLRTSGTGPAYGRISAHPQSSATTKAKVSRPRQRS
jgi:hypothetical protein